MARTLLVLVGVLLLLSGHLFVAGEIECPAHEHPVECYDPCQMECQYVERKGDSNNRLGCGRMPGKTACQEGCVCDENYVRKSRGGECVHEDVCIPSWRNLWAFWRWF